MGTSRRRLVLKPLGWPCILGEAPPGPFVVHPPGEGDPNVCLKTEYRKSGSDVPPGRMAEAYNSAGEAFVAGDGTQVQPLCAEWEEEE